MRRVDPNKATQKIELYQSTALEVDEQIRLRLQQMVANRVDTLVLAAVEQHIIQQVDQAVTRHLEGLLNPSGGNHSGSPLGQNALGSMQQLISNKFDMNNISQAVEAIVASRMEELFSYTTGSVPVPEQPINLQGVPEMTEDEALRQAQEQTGHGSRTPSQPLFGGNLPSKRLRKPDEGSS